MPTQNNKDKLHQRFVDSDYNFYDIITLNKNGSYNDNIDYFSYDYRRNIKFYVEHIHTCSKGKNKCHICYNLIIDFGKNEMNKWWRV